MVPQVPEMTNGINGTAHPDGSLRAFSFDSENEDVQYVRKERPEIDAEDGKSGIAQASVNR